MEPAVPQTSRLLSWLASKTPRSRFAAAASAYSRLCAVGGAVAAVLVHGFGAFRDESVATAHHRSGSLQAIKFSDPYAPPVGAAVRLLHGRDERVCPLATRDIAGDALGAHAEFAGDASSFVAQAFGARAASTRSTSSSPRPSAIASPMPTLP